MKMFFPAFILMVSTVSHASDFQINYAPKAWHFFNEKPLPNENINLIGVSYGHVGVFGYTNSYGGFSHGVSYESTLSKRGRFEFSVLTGVVFGYYEKYIKCRKTNNVSPFGPKVVYPLLAPAITWNLTDNFGVSVTQMGGASTLAFRFTN